MDSARTRHSAEDTARRGDALYEQRIRSHVEVTNAGKVVAIDIESGAYAVDDTALGAAHRLRSDRPEAEIWFVRIGKQAFRFIGQASRVVLR